MKVIFFLSKSIVKLEKEVFYEKNSHTNSWFDDNPYRVWQKNARGFSRKV